MNNKLSKIINPWVPKEGKVIDFGCGDGSLLEELMTVSYTHLRAHET